MGHAAFAKALGFKTEQIGDDLEKVIDGAIENEEELDNIIEKNFLDHSYFENEIKALLNLRANASRPIGGGCFGPLSIAATIVGTESLIKLTIKNPRFVEKIVDYVTKHIIDLAKLEKANGGDFFWAAEPVASLISPKKFWQFSGRYLKAIFDSVNQPSILHVCGKTLKHTDGMVATGAQVLSIDYLTDIEKNIRIVPRNVVIMGNINPMLLKYGSTEGITKEVMEVNEACKNYKNFIMSTGCAVPYGTPEENVQLLIDLTKEFQVWSNHEYRLLEKLIDLFICDNEAKANEFIAQYSPSQELVTAAKYESKKILEYKKENI
jgi:MtaA/CmuA family methyltransferase